MMLVFGCLLFKLINDFFEFRLRGFFLSFNINQFSFKAIKSEFDLISVLFFLID